MLRPTQLCRIALALILSLSLTRILGAWPGLETAARSGVEPTGACCRLDGVCMDGVTFTDCSQVGGWHAVGTTCLANACGPGGACCVNGVCSFGQSQGYCEGAAQGHWYPTCGDPKCNPVGACCVGDLCTEQTEHLCFLNGGVYLGSGSTCAGTSCRGACCLPNLGGCVLETEGGCLGVGGDFLGVGTFCNGFFCPGACCFPNGDCQELVEYDCSISGGTFYGGPCKSTHCPFTGGACCYADGTCVDGVDFGLCLEFNGAPGGVGSTCAETPCNLVGSCCFDFGGGFTFCRGVYFEAECTKQGGTFNGPGSICDKGTCVPGATGACCLPGGACISDTTLNICGANGGLYKGDGSVCTGSTCCAADFNHDGTVNTPDLTYFLGRFGQNFPPPGSEPADLVPDGTVNTLDLTKFLAAFGRVCPY